MDRSSDRQKNSPTLENSVEAICTLIPQISKERTTAPERLSELLSVSPSERGQLLASDPRFHTYSLAVQALRRAEAAVFHRPAPAVELAQLARSIASQVPPLFCGGTAALADLEAYTIAMEGNALRVSGDYQGSLRIFAMARRVQKDGGADPDLMARFDQLEASLRRDLGQFHTSLALLDRAAKVFRSLKAKDELARTLINRSNLFLVQEDFGKAKIFLAHALEFASNPALRYTFKHNLIDILVRSGQPRQAAQLLKESEDLYQERPDPLTTIRRIWLEGVIVRELRKDLERAGELLAEASARLGELGYAMAAHLARIDLTRVFRIRQAERATPVR